MSRARAPQPVQASLTESAYGDFFDDADPWPWWIGLAWIAGFVLSVGLLIYGIRAVVWAWGRFA